MNPPEMMRVADEGKESQDLEEAQAPLFGERGVDDLADDLARANFGIRKTPEFWTARRSGPTALPIPFSRRQSFRIAAMPALVALPNFGSRVLGIEIIGGRFASDRFRTLEFVCTEHLLASRWRVDSLVECSGPRGRSSRAGDRIVSVSPRAPISRFRARSWSAIRIQITRGAPGRLGSKPASYRSSL